MEENTKKSSPVMILAAWVLVGVPPVSWGMVGLARAMPTRPLLSAV